MIVILGSGLAGLSASYHIGNDKCILYEKNGYAGGHIHSEIIDGFTWDEGPHVSFTNNSYVKELFNDTVNCEILEYPVQIVNYFKNTWIPHPAQTNLYAIPQPVREDCLSGFLKARSFYNDNFIPKNYKEWLQFSFGDDFAQTFPAAYTRKYWTTEPENLTTDWVGERVYAPNEEQVKQSYYAPLDEKTNYIKKVRYPAKGGYISFADKLIKTANVKLGFELASIDFSLKTIVFTNGEQIKYTKLINTIPLPTLIERSNAPAEVKIAAKQLNCSSVFLVNITANHPTARADNWIYVYDEDKLSTRINCTEMLSPNNAPSGKTGIQVEVYYSVYNSPQHTPQETIDKVIDELLEMKLILSKEHVESCNSKWIKWANVIYDHKRERAQAVVLDYLTSVGLKREADDIKPMTDWDDKFGGNDELGDIILAGRFGQWKYYWTDDCVLRGKFIGERI